MKNILIRQATPGDQAAIEALAAEAYAIYLPRMDRKPFPMLDDYGAHIYARRAHVLEIEGETSGYLVFVPKEGESLSLESIVIAPRLQGLGYGRALMDFAEKAARKMGMKSARLYTNEAMRENIVFYGRLGYRETGRRVENGYRRVFFVKDIG